MKKGGFGANGVELKSCEFFFFQCASGSKNLVSCFRLTECFLVFSARGILSRVRLAKYFVYVARRVLSQGGCGLFSCGTVVVLFLFLFRVFIPAFCRLFRFIFVCRSLACVFAGGFCAS